MLRPLSSLNSAHLAHRAHRALIPTFIFTLTLTFALILTLSACIDTVCPDGQVAPSLRECAELEPEPDMSVPCVPDVSSTCSEGHVVSQDSCGQIGERLETCEPSSPCIVYEGRAQCGADGLPPCASSSVGCPELDWVTIEGGSFVMGNNDPPLSDESPAKMITLPDFEIMKTEITVAQYQMCVEAGECTPAGREEECNAEVMGREDHPINCVDWFQINAFTAWVGARLPSESEWEYAARGRGRAVEHAWGDDTPTCDYAIFDDGFGNGCSEDRTWPVCSKPRGNTPEGLCDMSGNIWEWVLDEYQEGYDDLPTDGSAWCESGACTTNTSMNYRSLRGGSYISLDVFMRVTDRSRHEPDGVREFRGGRAARIRTR